MGKGVIHGGSSLRALQERSSTTGIGYAIGRPQRGKKASEKEGKKEWASDFFALQVPTKEESLLLGTSQIAGLTLGEKYPEGGEGSRWLVH